MIAIGLLFVRMLCDYFKSRPQPEAKIVRQVGRYAVNHHEVRLVQLCFDFYMIEAKPGEFDRRSRLRQ